MPKVIVGPKYNKLKFESLNCNLSKLKGSKYCNSSKLKGTKLQVILKSKIMQGCERVKHSANCIELEFSSNIMTLLQKEIEDIVLN